jgi:hypothetical protein
MGQIQCAIESGCSFAYYQGTGIGLTGYKFMVTKDFSYFNPIDTPFPILEQGMQVTHAGDYFFTLGTYGTIGYSADGRFTL